MTPTQEDQIQTIRNLIINARDRLIIFINDNPEFKPHANFIPETLTSSIVNMYHLIEDNKREISDNMSYKRKIALERIRDELKLLDRE